MRLLLVSLHPVELRSEWREQVVQTVTPVTFGAVVDSAMLILDDVQAGDILAAGCVVRTNVAGSKFSRQRVLGDVVLSLNFLPGFELQNSVWKNVNDSCRDSVFDAFLVSQLTGRIELPLKLSVNCRCIQCRRRKIARVAKTDELFEFSFQDGSPLAVELRIHDHFRLLVDDDRHNVVQFNLRWNRRFDVDPRVVPYPFTVRAQHDRTGRPKSQRINCRRLPDSASVYCVTVPGRLQR